MVVCAFVFVARPGRQLKFILQTSEVAAARWVPVAQLLAPRMSHLPVPISSMFAGVPLGSLMVTLCYTCGVRCLFRSLSFAQLRAVAAASQFSRDRAA